MSHRIIISSAKAAPTSLDETTDEPASAVEYDITYIPSHSLTPEQVGDKVTKLLKLAGKMAE